MNKNAYYDENGILTFEIDQFIEDIQIYNTVTMSSENETFGHLVVNLPVLSGEGVPELCQHYIQLKAPLKKGQIDEVAQHQTSGSH